MGNLLLRKITEKCWQVGFFGTLKHIAKRLFWSLRPCYIRFLLSERAFDRKYGTETRGTITNGNLDVPQDKLEHAVRYEATSVELGNRILQELPISYENYIFVDFGSGKGRILLLASNFPFRKIIGVELLPLVNEIACNNIRIYKSESQKCYNLESVCLDAKDFEIPDEKAVFYFYHPFDEYVMRAVLSNIEASLKRYPRKIYIVYALPTYRDLMDGSAFLRNIRKEIISKKHWEDLILKYCIYESRNPS